MIIKGNIVFIKNNFVRLRTIKKGQEIDVFFTEKKFDAIDAWLEPYMFAEIEVESESIEVEEIKLAKLWFKFAVSPEPQTELFIGHSEPLRRRKNLLLTLFPKDFDSAK